MLREPAAAASTGLAGKGMPLRRFKTLSRQETPNSAGEWDFNVPNTSNISYEAKIDVVMFRIGSNSRNGMQQKKQLYV